MPIKSQIYLLAWIASSLTAAPRNDLLVVVSCYSQKQNTASRHCELAKQSMLGSDVILCNGLLCLVAVYLLAWIASSQTAAPRNDGTVVYGLFPVLYIAVTMTLFLYKRNGN